tara:strand:- start:16074 stop:17387 length:1314 start_codon:yes stop_codon:yes gene_type:complete
MPAKLRINLENKSVITTPPSGYISLFAGADAGAPFTNEHLSVINSAGTLLRVPYLEENLTVATGYNFQQNVDISGSLWVGTDHTVIANTTLGTTCVNTLLVNATSTFNCPVTFTGGITLSGNTDVCGDMNLCGCDTGTTPTLHVTQISACTGTLSISNNVDICGNLNLCCVLTDENFTGATSANTGTTAVTTTLTVTKVSGCSGTLQIDSNVTQTGDTTTFGSLTMSPPLSGTSTFIKFGQSGQIYSKATNRGLIELDDGGTQGDTQVKLQSNGGTEKIELNQDEGITVTGNLKGLNNVTAQDKLVFGYSGTTGTTWPGDFIHAGGTGRTVTQSASTTTTVTLNSSTGRIRAYNAGGAVLTTQTAAIFRVYNNKCRNEDSVVLLTCTNSDAPADANLTASLLIVQPGYFDIRLFNSGNGTVDLTEAGWIHFMIINHE